MKPVFTNYLRRIPKNFIFPFHAFLVSVFFVTHGYSEHHDVLQISSLLVLLFYLITISLIVYFGFLFLMKNKYKAGIFVTALMTVMLFYGAIEDFVGTFAFLANVARLTYVLSAIILIMIIAFVRIKRSQKSFIQASFFLNLLFTVYIAIDLITIAIERSALPEKQSTVSGDMLATDTSATLRPDIYLIILDQYAGTECLEKYFKYSNSRFEDTLRKLNFRVVRSPRSNYFNTNLSIGSLLNMRYLTKREHKMFRETFEGAKASVAIIENNAVCAYLEKRGYELSNYSIFNLHDRPAKYANPFIPIHENIIIEKTALYRLLKSIGPMLTIHFKISPLLNWLNEKLLDNNQIILKNSIKRPHQRVRKPIFQYVHLLMPHSPHGYDSTGKSVPILVPRSRADWLKHDSSYLQYLVYTNKRITDYISTLKKETENKAIILLMGDHGYRPAARFGESRFEFTTLNAIYLPNRDYTHFYDGITHVNQFRALFKTQFNRNFPLLKDSIVQ